MSYLEDLERMSVTDLLKQAAHRIDGIAMYFVCAICALFAMYSGLSDYFALPSAIPELHRLGGFPLLLFVPVILIVYISLQFYSTPGRFGRVINAIVLMGIPAYFAYKLDLFH